MSEAEFFLSFWVIFNSKLKRRSFLQLFGEFLRFVCICVFYFVFRHICFIIVGLIIYFEGWKVKLVFSRGTIETADSVHSTTIDFLKFFIRIITVIEKNFALQDWHFDSKMVSFSRFITALFLRYVNVLVYRYFLCVCILLALNLFQINWSFI